MAFLIKHALRANPSAKDSWSPKGWNPKVRAVVMGPTLDCELVLRVWKPDGSDWFEERTDVPELGEEVMHTAEMQWMEYEADVDEAGEARFTLSLVNELDGLDELLHDGVLWARRVEGEESPLYVLDSDWLMPLGLIALDFQSDTDAPQLRVTCFMGGGAEAYMVEAHLFHEGKRFAKADYVSSDWYSQRNDGGATQMIEVTAEFQNVRGWNNLADTGWGEEFHLLDSNPGHYEVKFTREKKVAKVVAFDVTDEGRIERVGRIEPDGWGRPTMWTTAESVGDFGETYDPSPLPGYAAYGDPTTAGVDWNSDAMYWYWAKRLAPSGGEDAEAGPAFDEETMETLTRFCDRATTLLNFWEADMERGLDKDEPVSFQSDYLNQCGLIVDDVGAFEDLRSAISGVPDDLPVDVFGSSTTVGDTLIRVRRLRTLAQSHLGQASQDEADELAPFRAVLANDKLHLFEDHPANSFEYLTINKKLIDTPEQLAEAEYWFFEGRLDLTGKGTVDGHDVSVTVPGWRVLGYKFDADGNTVDETETQGEGSSSPKSAYKEF